MLFQTIGLLNQAIKSNKMVANLPYTTNVKSLCKLLYKNGYISYYIVNENLTKIIVFFSTFENKPVINEFKVVSKAGSRRYVKVYQLKKKNYIEKKLFVLSTSKGLMLSNEALFLNIAGELICEIC